MRHIVHDGEDDRGNRGGALTIKTLGPGLWILAETSRHALQGPSSLLFALRLRADICVDGKAICSFLMFFVH